MHEHVSLRGTPDERDGRKLVDTVLRDRRCCERCVVTDIAPPPNAAVVDGVAAMSLSRDAVFATRPPLPVLLSRLLVLSRGAASDVDDAVVALVVRPLVPLVPSMTSSASASISDLTKRRASISTGQRGYTCNTIK